MVMDEVYLLAKHGNGGFPYNDIMKMPIYKRREFMKKLYIEADQQKKAHQSAMSKKK